MRGSSFFLRKQPQVNARKTRRCADAIYRSCAIVIMPPYVFTTSQKYFRPASKGLISTIAFLLHRVPVPACYAPAGSRAGSHLFREPFPFLEQNMTPRSIRRAAQRKANKLARKAAQHLSSADIQPTENHLAETEFPMQESATEPPAKTPPLTIPTPAAANVNLTAVTSALTGHATLLPTVDADQYGQLLRDYENEFQPVGLQESNLVQTLAETTWRARRTLALEMAIFAKGRIEFARQFAEHNPEIRVSLIEVHTFLTYEKQIRGLQTQEARLSRRADKASAELRGLQKRTPATGTEPTTPTRSNRPTKPPPRTKWLRIFKSRNQVISSRKASHPRPLRRRPRPLGRSQSRLKSTAIHPNLNTKPKRAQIK
jgi:hypothetical protein